MTMTFAQPLPAADQPSPLWSARRTALAVVAAVAIASVSAVAVSYADTGSSSTTGPGSGQFRPGFGGPGNFPGGQNLGGGGFGAPGQNGAVPPAQQGGTGQLPNPTHT